METSEYVVIFITTNTNKEAEHIARLMLEQRQAACVNILPKVHSCFWWEGNIDSAQESLLIIKTKASRLPEITGIVKGVHSNKVPEIIAIPIIGGNKEYLNWIEKEVA